MSGDPSWPSDPSVSAGGWTPAGGSEPVSGGGWTPSERSEPVSGAPISGGPVTGGPTLTEPQFVPGRVIKLPIGPGVQVLLRTRISKHTGQATVFVAELLDPLAEAGEAGDPVAVRVVLERRGRPDVLQRIRREQRYATALRHPFLLPVFAQAEMPEYRREFDGVCLALVQVMPLCEPEDLEDQVVKANPPRLTADQLLFDLVGIADALHHLHTPTSKRGVLIHRDVKPANILRWDRRSVLGDLGTLRDPQTNNPTGGVGTIPYMPPDEGTSPTPAWDMFSFGVVLAELLTARRPHEVAEKTPLAYLQAHLRHSLRPDLEKLLADEVGADRAAIAVDLVRRCTDPERGNRPSATEARDALLPLLSTAEQLRLHDLVTFDTVEALDTVAVAALQVHGDRHPITRRIAERLSATLVATAAGAVEKSQRQEYLSRARAIQAALAEYGPMPVEESTGPRVGPWTRTRPLPKTAFGSVPVAALGGSAASSGPLAISAPPAASGSAAVVAGARGPSSAADGGNMLAPPVELAWSAYGPGAVGVAEVAGVAAPAGPASRHPEPAGGALVPVDPWQGLLSGHPSGPPALGTNPPPPAGRKGRAVLLAGLAVLLVLVVVGVGALWFRSDQGASTATAGSSASPSVTPYQIGPSPAIETKFTGHTQWINAVAFSPDGKEIASGSGDSTVRLWNVESRSELGEPLTGHTGTVYRVAFSPNGNLLASVGGDGAVRLWNARAGTKVGVLPGHAGDAYGVAFSPDGKMLASCGGDRTVRLWDVATQKQIGAPMTGDTDEVYSVAFSPDGKTLATGSADDSVRLWDVKTRKQIGAPLVSVPGDIDAVAFSPDGNLLVAGGSDKVVRIWDVKKHALRDHAAALRGHTDNVYTLAWSPDGRTIATGSIDNSTRLWDVATGKQIGKPLAATGDIDAVTFSPNGRTLADGGDEKVVRLWDLDARPLN